MLVTMYSNFINFYFPDVNQMHFGDCAVGVPKCAKDISVLFTSDKPVTLDRVRINCKVVKIKLAKDGNKVSS